MVTTWEGGIKYEEYLILYILFLTLSYIIDCLMLKFIRFDKQGKIRYPESTFLRTFCQMNNFILLLIFLLFSYVMFEIFR